MCGAADLRSIFVSIMLYTSTNFLFIYRAVDLWSVDIQTVDVVSG